MSASTAWSSMTGYAQTDLGVGCRHFKLQIKSVNHRFFEFRIRAPREWQMLENDLKSWCKDALQRGSVDFYVEEARDIETSNDQNKKGDDFSKARAFAARLSAMMVATQDDWKHAMLSDAEKAQLLAKNAALWDSSPSTREEALPDTEELQGIVAGLCSKLISQRLEEGEETRKSVIEHGLYIRVQWEQIRSELPVLREAWKKNMEDRLQRLGESMGGSSPEPARVFQEFVMLADKRDVSEEIQRIESHLKALDLLATQPRENAIGKRLDFICQELNREWTTLSNKIQDARINQRVGEAKLTIEKIREQSLNLV